MSTIERSIEIGVPASEAYAFWTQFERFPEFMEGVKDVQQFGDRFLRWRADFWGVEEQWDAEITEQIPDKRIAWTSTAGVRNAGAVTFHRLGNDRCRVMLQMEIDPRGTLEKVGDFLGLTTRRVEGDLERFKAYVEDPTHHATAWQGEVRSKPDAAQSASAR